MENVSVDSFVRWWRSDTGQLAHSVSQHSNTTQNAWHGFSGVQQSEEGVHTNLVKSILVKYLGNY